MATNTFVTSDQGKALYHGKKIQPFTLSIKYSGSAKKDTLVKQSQKLLIETFLQPDQYLQPPKDNLCGYSTADPDFKVGRPLATAELVKFFQANPKYPNQVHIHAQIASLFNYAAVARAAATLSTKPALQVTPASLAEYYLQCLMATTNQALPNTKDKGRVVVIFVVRPSVSFGVCSAVILC